MKLPAAGDRPVMSTPELAHTHMAKSEHQGRRPQDRESPPLFRLQNSMTSWALSIVNRAGNCLDVRRWGRVVGDVEGALSRRTLLRVLSAAAIPAVAGGCSAGSATAPLDTASAPGPLVWFAGEITQGANDLRWAMRDAFERFEPGIAVNVVSGPQSTDSMRLTMTSVLSPGAVEPDADRPDVYLGDVIWPAQFGAGGYALALDDPQALGPGYFSRFPRVLVQASSYQGHTYAAPFYTEQGLLYYRKDLLARHGIAPPATWEELKAAVLALKAAGEGTYQFAWQGAEYEGLTCNWIEYLADALGRPDPVSSPADLASSAAVDALAFMQDLIASGVSPGDVRKWQEVQSIDAFSGGQAAFLRGWNSSWNTILPGTTPDEKRSMVGVAPLPGFARHPGGPSGVGYSTAGGWSVFVNPRTDKLGASLDFVRWLTDEQAQRMLLTQGGLAPSVTSVQNDAKAGVSPPLIAARHTSLAIRPSNTPAYPSVTEILFNSVHSVLAGRHTPQNALQTAAQSIQKIVGT